MGYMDLEYILYNIQHSFGIQPKWERELIKGDLHLQTFLQWKKSNKCCKDVCEKLYHNRLNYLKGWINKE
jgi:hypothetical protein